MERTGAACRLRPGIQALACTSQLQSLPHLQSGPQAHVALAATFWQPQSQAAPGQD